MTTRTFTTAAVISSHTGYLLCDIGDIYTVLGHVLGDDTLMTHQLPAASRAAAPVMEAQLPWLTGLTDLVPDGDVTDKLAWLAQMVDQHGVTQQLTTAPPDTWLAHNGLTDMLDIADGRPVHVVMPPEGTP